MKHYGDLYEQQMKWFETIDALEALPEEERIVMYREEVQKVEKSILRLTGDPLKRNTRLNERLAIPEEGNRYYSL